MNKELNERVVNAIHKYLPKDKSIVSYLMDTLDLGRESAYRRVRNEISFTFEEISALSLNLGYSVDEIIGADKKNRVFFDLQSTRSTDPAEAFLIMIKQNHNLIMRLYHAEQTEIIISLNHMSSVLSIYYDNLFKFFYFKWCHQINRVPFNFYFADNEVPPEIIDIYKETVVYGGMINNNIYILDKNVYLNTIREIQYFYQRKLLSLEELLLLKEDLLHQINVHEEYVRAGINENSFRLDYYLSQFEIESNVSYLEYDGNIETHFWIHQATNPIIIKDKEVGDIYKTWLISLKKYSIQMSKSNELLQAEFFNQQHEYLDNMDKIMY